jgi:hypothetical protein
LGVELGGHRERIVESLAGDEAVQTLRVIGFG